jgi:uncharacterized protein YkwD
MKSVLRAFATLSAAASLIVLGLVVAPVTTANAARPTGSSMSVKVLAAEGGTVVTITGKNLKKVNAVYFGVTKTTKIKHLSKTKLRVTAPAHKPGKVAIKLRVGSKKYSTSLSARYVATPVTPSAFEAEVLRLTNLQRVAGYTCTDAKTGQTAVMPPVPALAWNAQLTSAARLHSADMGAKNYFSHTSLDGTAFSERITRAGYVWRTAGENIAAGYGTPAAVVDGWMDSFGHCENIMSGAFTDLGVGYASVPGSTYGDYWTQDFGAPR